jgi:hypothetical protein
VTRLPGSPDTLPPEPRLWTPEAWRTLAAKIVGLVIGGGDTSIDFRSRWLGNVRWGRNSINTSGDIRDHTLILNRNVHGAGQAMTLNQLDDAALRGAMAWMEQAIALYREEELDPSRFPAFSSDDYLHPKLYFEATADFDKEQRARTVTTAIAPAVRAGMLSAGYVEATASGLGVYKPWQQMDLYQPMTEAQYSVTVRDPEGTGSGWAGVNWNDVTRIDIESLSAIALEKCNSSRNPVAIEPGRYTLIMEPQAVHDFGSQILLDQDFSWPVALDPGRPPSNPNRTKYHDYGSDIGTKIGQQQLDSRLTIRADPMDPDLGFVPFNEYSGEPNRPAVWFDHGILTHLPYGRQFAINHGLGNTGLPNSRNYRMDGTGPLVSIDEMIATTKRGLLVTRFSNVTTIDQNSLLLSGYTRDGLWLIENGKISKPVKNFRFTESPFFAFNNVEQIGVPQRVFWPGHAAVVPPLKVKDFSFTSLSDAV